jgi:hypothetical protein
VTPKTDSKDARTDVDLIAAINRGDADAFEVLYPAPKKQFLISL